MKKIFIVLVIILNSNASTLFEYSIAVDYIYDSNIARNTTEVSKHYVAPEIDLMYYPFSPVDFFASARVTYDFYVKERDADDNSPFVAGGVGVKLGKKKFRIIPEFYMEQYLLAEGYFLKEDGELTSKTWAPFLRTFNLNVQLLRKKKKIAIYTNALLSYFDYNDNTTNNEGLFLELKPEIKYLFKKKRKSIGVKSVCAAIQYNGKYVDLKSESYNKLMMILEADIKFWQARLSTALEGGRKIYTEACEHPHSGEEVNETISYLNIKPSIKVDLISDLELNVGTALKFRDSNFPNEEFYRYTFFAGVKWDSKLKRKNDK